ncbi:hypothetical protein hbim_04393 [Mycolicibacterium mageritense]|uniref:Acyl-CoA dehydrogenase/oxidase N-terminal domain-containing protein n=1 Tax=Mycolicibacterium mageritense TaxID=53462 RepID=A0AAI8TWY8_MYCME|nr:hypothetical protein hbim_04393 [Mycolicibacterium mageritense]
MDVMTISLAERAELQAAVRDLLTDECTEQDVRRVMAGDDGFDRELWAKLAAQGVTGLLVESEFGGVGLGAPELEAVAEETGAALLPAPFLASAVLAVAAIQAAGTPQDKQRLLPGLADGTAIGTVALTGRRGTWTPDGVDVVANADGTLSGSAHYVLGGQVADVILVAARTAVSACSRSEPTPPGSPERLQQFSTRRYGCRCSRSPRRPRSASAPRAGRRPRRHSTSR